MDNLVEVSVLVPKEKLSRFYTLHGRLLKETDEREDVVPTRSERRGPGRPRKEEGRPSDGRRRGPGRPPKNEGRGPARMSLRSPAERSAAWAEGSNEQRLADAREYYTTLSDTARRFLDLMIDDERSNIPSAELIASLGLESNRVLAGSLSSFGRKARRIGRVQPFGFETDDSGATISHLPEDIADLFREARAQG